MYCSPSELSSHTSVALMLVALTTSPHTESTPARMTQDVPADSGADSAPPGEQRQLIRRDADSPEANISRDQAVHTGGAAKGGELVEGRDADRPPEGADDVRKDEE